MQRQTIPVVDHPSNLDPTARLVAFGREARWDVFSVKGGFMAGATLPGLRFVCVEGLFADLDEARRAAMALVGEGA